ncbi:uncharacterized protein MELLADRAFT_123761 [Melampsora larici-populina 98AG31]|uniref:Secreted protein n=1 Tax=Melampsora larici-populina (strain 98AG31 / pathotype 3-4-7) TaxID=747676 RepID=F4R5F1_MELLP|nr:uncharacterized protein MELLADRAFT_123761 [Melampsora larici-populina 98AG31]EGG12034.1 secreted protein [Melampsora larici-populina 98AG31]
MLYAFLKISTLLFSLWLHGSNVMVAGEQTKIFSCTRRFTLSSATQAVCKMDSPDEKDYTCSLNTCWYQGHQWIPMSSCVLTRSPQGSSKQHCAQYEFLSFEKGFSCINPAKYHYTCDYLENAGKVMQCTTCT